jgi:thiol peroxidase
MTEINFQGKPIHITGTLPKVGQKAPDFSLTNSKLKDDSLATFTGKKKLLNIVPSLDTPTCAISARKFNEKASRLKDTVVLMISADLPFAQDRFCGKEGLKDVIPLSTFRSSFANDYGVMIADSVLAGLTARAVVIIDDEDTVVYTQLVQEIANEPDYEDVFQALGELK